MKRTNLVLDEELLKQATRLLGARTYSAAVNEALREIVRVKNVEGIAEFFGSGIWQGDLAAMRRTRSQEEVPKRRSPASKRHK